jgi:hypothetical protein
MLVSNAYYQGNGSVVVGWFSNVDVDNFNGGGFGGSRFDGSGFFSSDGVGAREICNSRFSGRQKCFGILPFAFGKIVLLLLLVAVEFTRNGGAEELGTRNKRDVYAAGRRQPRRMISLVDSEGRPPERKEIQLTSGKPDRLGGKGS